MEAKKIIKNNWIFVVVFAFLSRIFLIDRVKIIMWDAAVYLMNSKWFVGEQVFWEVLRAPLLPFLISPLTMLNAPEVAYIIFSVLVSILSIIVTYFVAKEFFGEKAGILSALILAVVPLHIFWSPQIYTEILGSIFVLGCVYFLWKYDKSNKDIFLYLCGLMAGFAFLSRYPLGLILPAIFIFLLLRKKLTLKNILIVSVLFGLVALPWFAYNYSIFGDPIHSIREGVRWKGQGVMPYAYYLIELPAAMSFAFLIVAFGFFYSLKHLKKPKMQLLLITILIFFTFLTIDKHKEIRYFLPMFPLIIIFSSYFIEKVDFKKFGWIAFGIVLITGMFTLSSVPNTYPSCDGIIEASEDLESVVASVYWPQTAYYGNVSVRAMPAERNELEGFVNRYDISYIIISSTPLFPEYANDFEYFDGLEYLELERVVEDNCQTLRVYKVI